MTDGNKTHFFLFFVFFCLLLERFGDLERAVVVDGVDDDDAVGDAEQVPGKLLRKAVGIFRLDAFGVEESDDVDGAAVGRDVGVVDVLDGWMEWLRRKTKRTCIKLALHN